MRICQAEGCNNSIEHRHKRAKFCEECARKRYLEMNRKKSLDNYYENRDDPTFKAKRHEAYKKWLRKKGRPVYKTRKLKRPIHKQAYHAVDLQYCPMGQTEKMLNNIIEGRIVYVGFGG